MLGSSLQPGMLTLRVPLLPNLLPLRLIQHLELLLLLLLLRIHQASPLTQRLCLLSLPLLMPGTPLPTQTCTS